MNNEKFLEKYREDKTSVWVKLTLSDGSDVFFNDYKVWRSLKKYCQEKSLFVEDFRLQFRSHEIKIDVTDIDGLYFIRSVLGQMGGDTKNYYTVGTIKSGVVRKKMWLIPELIEEKSYEDDIESCFEEGIIYDEREKKEKDGQE